jgi:hypothetical protein
MEVGLRKRKRERRQKWGKEKENRNQEEGWERVAERDRQGVLVSKRGRSVDCGNTRQFELAY